MGFILKIYFLGMVAFLPSPQGDEMTVLVLDARHGHVLSDGSRMEEHQPLLLARAADCEGDCTADLAAAADFVFSEPGGRLPRLARALADGGAWQLDGSDLALRWEAADSARPAEALRIHGYGPDGNGAARLAALPLDDADPEHFGFVAEIGKIAPGHGAVDPDVLAGRPRKGLIAARLSLGSGELRTQRLVMLEDEVVEVGFRPLGGQEPSSYAQPLADRVVAEIRVPACRVTIAERRFDGSPGRSLTLAPERCDGRGVVEVALLNLPKESFSPPAGDRHAAEAVGRHFEMYYTLSSDPPPPAERPVPYPARRLESRSRMQQQRAATASTLLSELGLLPGRGAHSRPMCPVGQFDPGDDGG
jgi:hypothetical protein